MPAHRKHFLLDSRFIASQKLIQLFVNRGFILLLANQYNTKDIAKLSKTLMVDTDTARSTQSLANLDEALDFITLILSTLNNHLKINSDEPVSLVGEWNYLGQNEDREHYLSFIEELFWTHQDNETLKFHPQFHEMTENPWKILLHAADFEFEIPSPADNFNENTISFVEKLLLKLNNWELSPYLVTNNSSNFHWSIKLNGERLITGTISKTDDGLIHETEFDV